MKQGCSKMSATACAPCMVWHMISCASARKAGLSEQFAIVDEGESEKMIAEITSAYQREHSELVELYLSADLNSSSANQTRNQWNDLLATICSHFISQAKNLLAEPAEVQEWVDQNKILDPMMLMAVNVYAQYQRGLRFRNAVDFTDLIRLAYQVLLADPDYLMRLHHRWKYILEDEAQDSSYLQEQILNLIVGTDGNWVRVGDPNQAIYETFTTANPKYLRNFLEAPGVLKLSLPNSGRSNQSIIRLANQLISWTIQEHPVEALRKSLSHPLIEPAPPGDPQPNPPDRPDAIYIHKEKLKPENEIAMVARSLKTWLPNHPDKTVAVLVPIGKHGEKMVEELNRAGISVVEMLKSSQSTRKAARLIERILISLADPSSPPRCAAPSRISTI